MGERQESPPAYVPLEMLPSCAIVACILQMKLLQAGLHANSTRDIEQLGGDECGLFCEGSVDKSFPIHSLERGCQYFNVVNVFNITKKSKFIAYADDISI